MTTIEPETTIFPQNDGSPTDSRTPAPKAKRPSRATKAAAKNVKPEGKVTPIKPKPAAAKKDEPGTNDLKNKIADAMIAFVGERFVTRETAKRLGVPFDLLQAESGRTLSYAPGKAWHKNLTSPGTGRGQRHAL